MTSDFNQLTREWKNAESYLDSTVLKQPSAFLKQSSISRTKQKERKHILILNFFFYALKIKYIEY